MKEFLLYMFIGIIFEWICYYYSKKAILNNDKYKLDDNTIRWLNFYINTDVIRFFFIFTWPVIFTKWIYEIFKIIFKK